MNSVSWLQHARTYLGIRELKNCLVKLHMVTENHVVPNTITATIFSLMCYIPL